jgi:hypothetical protein
MSISFGFAPRLGVEDVAAFKYQAASGLLDVIL